MHALDQLIPVPRLLELDEVEIAAPNARVWDAVRRGDLAETPGFQVLVDAAPHELVVGAIGKVWQPNTAFVPIADASAFAAFSQPGFIKVAKAVRAEASRVGFTRVTIELRVDSTDAEAWHAFEHSVQSIGPPRFIRQSHLSALARELSARHEPLPGDVLFAAAADDDDDDARDVLEGIGGAARVALELVAPFGRQQPLHWGIGAEELNRSFPGDELVPEPRWSWTHAIGVRASAEQVWPWVAQIGAKRAGFYSQEWLENLAGCDVRNAEIVHPEWQAKIGDDFFLHPQAPPLRVTAVEPGRWFVVHASADPKLCARYERRASVSWLLLVERKGSARCRVISRFRAVYSDELAARLSVGPTLLRPIGFVLDRRMLEGIRERAQRAAAEARAAFRHGN